MCLARAWDTGFFARAMALWLSEKRSVGSSELPFEWPSSARSVLIHFNSFVASVRAIYSDSIVDNATVGCRRLFHSIAPLLSMTVYSIVECRVSISPAHSASEYPWRRRGGARYKILCVEVPWR